MTALDHAPVRFELPPDLEASAPPESRGLRRDAVRLMVAAPAGVRHTRFRALAEHLRAGDVLVVNTSATLPAGLPAVRADGTAVDVHFSAPTADGAWVVELRIDGGPLGDAVAGERLVAAGGAPLAVTGSFDGRGRLWLARLLSDEPVEHHLARHGRPIRYAYVPGHWPLAAYQTVFATEPGSAEMPSAGRPFTDALVTRLVTRGVLVVPVTLHTGVSSLEDGEPPYPERFAVPPATAALVQDAVRDGRRVVAVGTTVVRALETVASEDGRVRPGHGETGLVLGPERPARVVTGLVTGWHAPGASHLRLLEAVAGAPLVRRAYAEALAHRYRWHEFGDSCLLLP